MEKTKEIRKVVYVSDEADKRANMRVAELGNARNKRMTKCEYVSNLIINDK